MLTSVNGNNNESQIVMDEATMLQNEQRLINTGPDAEIPTRNRTIPELSKYMGRGEKMFHTDAESYVRELRENDRM